jgi:hypothetical protein
VPSGLGVEGQCGYDLFFGFYLKRLAAGLIEYERHARASGGEISKLKY